LESELLTFFKKLFNFRRKEVSRVGFLQSKALPLQGRMPFNGSFFYEQF